MKFIFVIFTLMFAGCAAIPPRPMPPSVAEVVQMAKDKAPAQDIIQRMRESGAVYRLSASQLARLREQGVPDEVIDHMQETWLFEARREAAGRMFPYEPLPPGFGLMHDLRRPPSWPYWPYFPYGRDLRSPWGW